MGEDNGDDPEGNPGVLPVLSGLFAIGFCSAGSPRFMGNASEESGTEFTGKPDPGETMLLLVAPLNAALLGKALLSVVCDN
jgi:hypothetical protein